MNNYLPEQKILPCGEIGWLENDYAYRCDSCMAVWGSIACGCSNELRKIEKNEKSKTKTTKI